MDLMRALAPELGAVELESLGELRVGFAWLERADPLVRARVEAVLAFLPHHWPVDLPLNDPAEYRLFMREVADVHRGLFPERADEYGENAGGKIERCMQVTDEQVEIARRLRAEYRERCEEATRGIDLLLTPTIPFVAPPADVDELTIRERGISLTFPFDSLGWPALALPCGPAEDGLPASVQIVGPREADSLVLAAGAVLASLI
jgi:Asp-tRNA(Asn)/Glu-tRNA(Gln) amidotransferase A subunit family amidase